MAKKWAGRTDGQIEKIADDFNSSIRFDCRMYKQDITGSMVHAAIPAAQSIITQDDADALIAGLEQILADIDLVTCVEKWISEGGTFNASVKTQNAYVRQVLAK